MIEGWLTDDEGQRLRELAAACPPELAIVEIGAYKGRSTAWLAAGAALGGSHVVTVDPWSGPEPAYNDAALAAFRQNMTAEGLWPHVTPLRTWSDDAALSWVKPIGLLFIDGDHMYDGVLSDYLAWRPHIQGGGWLAFHDCNVDHPGVLGTVQEVVIPTGPWRTAEQVDSLWTAQRD